MTSINRISPHGLKALFETLTAGAGDLEGGAVQAMILGANTTLDAEWESCVDLTTGVSTLSEFTSGGGTTHRVTCSGMTGSTLSAEFRFSISAPVWSALPVGDAGPGAPTHVLFYVKKSGAAADDSLADRVPLAICDAEFTPDGSDFTALQPVNGLFAIDTTEV